MFAADCGPFLPIKVEAATCCYGLLCRLSRNSTAQAIRAALSTQMRGLAAKASNS